MCRCLDSLLAMPVSGVVQDALKDLAVTANAAKPQTTDVGRSKHVTSHIATRLKGLISSTKRNEEPVIPIVRMLTLANVGTLERIFIAEGGRNAKTLPMHRFVTAVEEVLRSNARREYESEDGLNVAIRRWCVAFSKPSVAKVKRGGGTIYRSAPDDARDKISLASTSLVQGNAMDTLSVSWSDFTGHMLAHGQQRVLSEETSGSYKTLPSASVISSQGSDRRPPRRVAYYEHTETAHDIPPCCAISSSRRQTLLSGSHDGVVKEWDLHSGAFMRNLYNAGRGWVVGMFFADEQDHDLLVGTSSSHVALCHVTASRSMLVREFIGSADAKGVPSAIPQRSTSHTHRYGFQPGDKGVAKATVDLRDPDLTQEEFIERWREAVEGPPPANVPVTPIVGMTGMTAFWQVQGGQCAYGTNAGQVGMFDLTAQIEHFASSLANEGSSSIVASPMALHHTQFVTSLRHSRRHSVLISGSLDGGIFRHDLDSGLTTKTYHENERAVVAMEWCERQQLLCSSAPDGKVRLWSLLRAEPQHVLSVGSDAISMAIHPGRDQLIVLTAGHQLKIFDLRTMRCLESIDHSDDHKAKRHAVVGAGAAGASTPENRHGVVVHDKTTNQVVTVLKKPIRLQEAGATTGLRSAVTAMAGRRLTITRKPASAHPSSVISLHWNSNSKTLFSCCRDTISAWDVDTGEHIYASEVAKQFGVLTNGATPGAIVNMSQKSRQSTLTTLMNNGDFVSWNPLNGHITDYVPNDIWAPSKRNRLPTWDFSACVHLPNMIAAAFGQSVFAVPADRAELLRNHADQQAALNRSANRRPGSPPLTPRKADLIQEHTDPLAARFRTTTNVTCLAALKGDAIAVGTVSGELYIHNLVTGNTYCVMLEGNTKSHRMKRPRDQHHSDSSDGDDDLADAATNVTSIETVLWSHREQRALVFALQTCGAVGVFQTSSRQLLGTFSLASTDAPHVQFVTAILSVDEGFLIVGDSVGRIHVLDVFNAHHAKPQDSTMSPTVSRFGRRAVLSDSGGSPLLQTVRHSVRFGDTWRDLTSETDSIEDHPVRGPIRPRMTVANGNAAPHVTRHAPLRAGQNTARVEFARANDAGIDGAREPLTAREASRSEGLPLVPAAPLTARGGSIDWSATLTTLRAASHFLSPRGLATVPETCPLQISHVSTFTACDEGIACIIHIPSRGCFVSGGFDGTLRMWTMDRSTATFTGDFVNGAKASTPQERRYQVMAHFPAAAEPAVNTAAPVDHSQSAEPPLQRRFTAEPPGFFVTQLGDGSVSGSARALIESDAATRDTGVAVSLMVDPVAVAAQRLQRAGVNMTARGLVPAPPSALPAERTDHASQSVRQERAVRLAVFRDRHTARARSVHVGAGWAGRASSHLTLSALHGTKAPEDQPASMPVNLQDL
jgi:WD40 repeat protein